MKNLTLLSHPLESSTPCYAGAHDFTREPASQISAGKSSNSERWSFKNHTGTHIDFPRHFFTDGQSLSDLNPDHFYFSVTLLHQMPLAPDHIITPEDLGRLQDPPAVAAKVELLLFCTGFEKHRSNSIYWEHNPGFHPSCAIALRKRYPKLRAIGFDFLSLTAFQERELGREAHREFLNPANPIWIIEDMKLSNLKMSQFQTLAAPLLVAHADGSPVTVFAFDPTP